MIHKDDDMVGTLFHDVAHLIRHQIDDELRPYDLTRASWLAIGIVQSNDRLSQAELAESLELGAAATGKVVDRLEERGLIERHADPDDRRTKRLSVTSEGKKLIRKLRPIGVKIRDSVLQDLNEADQKRLLSYLVKIKTRLSKSKEAKSIQDS